MAVRASSSPVNLTRLSPGTGGDDATWQGWVQLTSMLNRASVVSLGLASSDFPQ